MTDRELLELIAQQVGVLTKDVGELKGLKNDVGGLKDDVGELKKEVSDLKVELKKTNNVIENDIKPKIEALFDGQLQNTARLERIEAEVVKHEEFILKRVR